MKPNNLKTKIFLDSGDPAETKQALESLGFLDGQTTNPSLVAKNPQAQERLASGQKFSAEEVKDFYKKIAQEVSSLIPQGSVSLEVYADNTTSAEDALTQAREMNTWIPNAHIKFPITPECLKAAQTAIAEGMRLNMTLCFSEAQAAAVYEATTGAKKGDVFVSPFIGRLDDIGQNGMDLIKNCLALYKSGDGHVEVLAASVRGMDHFLASLALGADIITAPLKILKEWTEAGMPVPTEIDYTYPRTDLTPIPQSAITLGKPVTEYEVHHDLTDQGLEKFTKDWNSIIIA